MQGIFTTEELAQAKEKEFGEAHKKGAVQFTESKDVAPPPTVTPLLPKGMASKVERMPDGEVIADFANPVPRCTQPTVVHTAPAGSTAVDWSDRAFKENFLKTLKDWLDLWHTLGVHAKQERMMDALAAMGNLGSWATMIVQTTQSSKWGSPL